MDTELTKNLEHFLGQMRREPVISGLEPVSQRLGKLFAGGASRLEPEHLFDFCLAYINLAPGQAETINRCAQSLNLTLLVTNYTELATRYLDSACRELENGEPKEPAESFLILLQGAYIFARMLEELDDKVQAFVGVPLSDVDLMDANLIVHEIIGDNFSNRLDKVITGLVQQSKISKSLIEANLDQTLITQARHKGLSLSGSEVKSFAEGYGLSMISGLA